MIHTRIWRSEKVAAFDFRERLLWVGLVTNADDQGRGRAHPGLVRSDIFPLDDVSLAAISEALSQFEQADMLQLYEADGKPLYQIVNWWGYQGAMHWAWPSDFPPPDGWEDRIRYRKGNTVVEQNWNESGGRLDDEPDDDEPTTSPPRAHDEPTPKPAPNGNGNGNLNGNGISEDMGADAAAGAAPSVPSNRREWLECLDKYKNSTGLALRMIEGLYPGLDPPPSYGQVGGIAKQMGRGKHGFRRLMGLLWDCNGRHIDGDLLPYLLRVHQGQQRDNGQGPAAATTAEERRAYITGEYADLIRHTEEDE
jgi:hypothetical protein